MDRLYIIHICVYIYMFMSRIGVYAFPQDAAADHREHRSPGALPAERRFHGVEGSSVRHGAVTLFNKGFNRDFIVI